MPPRQFVTARDVAKEAQVSQSAVSRAFTPGASVSPLTRARILAVAERLGYRPNLLARSLNHGRSNIVGVGVGELANPFFADTLSQLAIALEAAGLRMMLFPVDDQQHEPTVTEILHYRLDALILLSVGLSSTLARECRNAQVPILLYNRTTRDPDISSVTGDNAGGARAIADYLVATGHQRIAYLAGTEGSSTNAAREQAFFDQLARLGAAPPRRTQGFYDHDRAASATRQLLTGADRPDAIFCANDAMAIAAINVARHELGLDVGRALSIVGFDDVPMAAWPAFSLSSYAQPVARMIAETMDVIRALKDAPGQPAKIVVGGTLVLRGSSRPVRALADGNRAG